MGDGRPGRKRWMRSTGSENRMGGAGVRDIDLAAETPGLLPHQKGVVEADPRVKLHGPETQGPSLAASPAFARAVGAR